MWPSRVLLRTLIPMLVLGLLLGGCVMPARQEEAPTQPPAEPPVDQPAPEMSAEDLIAIVSQDANVRTGPSTDSAIAYWLTAGAEVKIVGRNEDATWLRIEHADRPGWIFAALTDVAAEVAELPAEAPPAEPTPEPAPEPEPSLPTVTVVGTVVTLRQEPGTEHAPAGQVRAGDELHVTGRNADGQWLQVFDPHTGQRAWVYRPLTDIDGAIVDTLAMTEPITVATLPPEREELTLEESLALRGALLVHWGARVIDTVVDVRDGPGTEYAQVGQARADDLLLVVGRNADSSWIQILNLGPPISFDPAADLVWVPAPLLDFSARTAPTVRDVTAALADVAPELWPRVEWSAPYMMPRIVGANSSEFEVVWRDGSAQWDWELSNGADCHTGLRILLDELPERFGIAQFVLTLTDPPVARNLTGHAPGDFVAWRYHAQPETEHAFNLTAWPDWEPTVGDRHAVAGAECVHMDARFGTDTGTIACDVYPLWGQPGHWLDGAVNIVLAQTMGVVGFVGDNDHAGADAWLDSTWPHLALLMPHIDYTAVGPSVCAHVSRSE